MHIMIGHSGQAIPDGLVCLTLGLLPEFAGSTDEIGAVGHDFLLMDLCYTRRAAPRHADNQDRLAQVPAEWCPGGRPSLGTSLRELQGRRERPIPSPVSDNHEPLFL